jgi:5'-phosphate synthase pdxT subunit
VAGRIGVLALQGAFEAHRRVLTALGVDAIEVRRPIHLDECDGLVLPGGESTTMIKQIASFGFYDPIATFAQERPLFGTCAGMILMGNDYLQLIDIDVERNAYGRQVHSFSADIQLSEEEKPFHALFIRAPGVASTGDSVEIMSTLGGTPILVRQGRHMAAAFHPELTNDPRIHKIFLDLVYGDNRSTLHSPDACNR